MLAALAITSICLILTWRPGCSHSLCGRRKAACAQAACLLNCAHMAVNVGGISQDARCSFRVYAQQGMAVWGPLSDALAPAGLFWSLVTCADLCLLNILEDGPVGVSWSGLPPGTTPT